jgi:single-stranded DNA-binding protein
MAQVVITGTVTRQPYYKEGDTPFAACTLNETYVDRRSGETKSAGYHDIVAFDDEARVLANLGPESRVTVTANIRYRADKRFVSTKDPSKNPYMVQYVVTKVEEEIF